MNLLIVTQKVDKDDDLLGFFHGWLEEFAEHFNTIRVICLYEGTHSLPENVTIHSLGKENEVSRFTYVYRFYKYIFKYRNSYDSVLVHMNPEYVFLGGLFWKLWKKKLLLWYNHPKGGFFLRTSHSLLNHILCTSPHAFATRYKQTILMPAGIDTDFFINRGDDRIEHSALVLGRISPVKKLDALPDIVATFDELGVLLSLSIVGDAPSQDKVYERKIKKALESYIEKKLVRCFHAVSQTKAVDFYNTHRVYINLTPDGSFDKTILEAIACGTLPLVTNKAYVSVLPEDCVAEAGSVEDIATKLGILLNRDDTATNELKERLRSYVIEHHSLKALATKVKEVCAQ